MKNRAAQWKHPCFTLSQRDRGDCVFLPTREGWLYAANVWRLIFWRSKEPSCENNLRGEKHLFFSHVVVSSSNTMALCPFLVRLAVKTNTLLSVCFYELTLMVLLQLLTERETHTQTLWSVTLKSWRICHIIARFSHFSTLICQGQRKINVFLFTFLNRRSENSLCI